MTKYTYQNNGFAALETNGKANLIGEVKKNQIAYVHESISIITAPTLEELKATLTERGIKFKEPTSTN